MQTPRANLFLERVLPTIPSDAQVSASQCLNTRFTHHAACCEFPDGIDKADYVVLQEYEPIDTGPAWSQARIADENTRFIGFERV